MTEGNEQITAGLIILGICGVIIVCIYRVALWVMSAPRTPDPWEKEVEDAVNDEHAVPLCCHCLTPQEHNGWFCPECGATVGPYVNYLPYVYIFSQGEVLRAGTTERIKRSPLVTIGFILFSISMYAIAAPVYLYFMLKNVHRSDLPSESN